MHKSSRTLVTAFSLLSMIPFIAGVLLYYVEWFHATQFGLEIFVTYSAIILSFLCGVSWGKTLEAPYHNQGKLLLFSCRIISFVAWASLLFDQAQMSLTLLLLGYISMFAVEVKGLKVIRPDEKLYPNIRFSLTILVCSMHILMLYPKY